MNYKRIITIDTLEGERFVFDGKTEHEEKVYRLSLYVNGFYNKNGETINVGVGQRNDISVFVTEETVEKLKLLSRKEIPEDKTTVEDLFKEIISELLPELL